MANNQRKFEELKSLVEEKKNELAEARGKLESTKQAAKDEFETDDIKELEKLKESYEKKKKKLEKRLTELEEEIENLLNQMENGDNE